MSESPCSRRLEMRRKPVEQRGTLRPVSERSPAPVSERLAEESPGPIGGPGLRVLFVGINPSLRSAEVGHHFARPGNRFWPTLYAAGFTPRLLAPREDGLLPTFGLGIVNFVGRATRSASELTDAELRAGADAVEAIVRAWTPRLVAVVGVGAYRAGFRRPQAIVGLQEERLAGRPVWVLPNPSGLNAHYRPADFARLYGRARRYADTLR
jgi:TDG/mug DNA glycosylase family protein